MTNTPHTTAIRQILNEFNESLGQPIDAIEEELLLGIISRHLAPLLEQAEKARDQAVTDGQECWNNSQEAMATLLSERDEALARAAAAEGELADLREVHAASVEQEKVACDAVDKFRDERDTALAKLAAYEAESNDLLRACLPHIRYDKSCQCSGCDGLRQLNDRISAHLAGSKGDGHE